MHVPTNAELEASAPDTAWEAVRGWLARHMPDVKGGPARQVSREKWLDWAATNLINDPEIRGAWRKEYGATTK